MRGLLALGVIFLASGNLYADIFITPTMIRGSEVPAGTWQEVVKLTTKTGFCTATIVGPRALVTSALCAPEPFPDVSFTYKGKTYSAKHTRSELQKTRGHNLGLVVTTEDITDARPHKIGGTVTSGTTLTMLGYGCTSGATPGQTDGVLRIGTNKVSGFLGLFLVSNDSQGAAICYGDEGGPGFVKEGELYLVAGVADMGNLKDKNRHVRMDTQESKDFFAKFTGQGVTICGINSGCGGEPPPVQDPTCQLTANPQTIDLNGSLSLVLKTENAVSADIDGNPANVPNFEKRITGTTAGNFTSTATVRNSAGKSATCSANYTVRGSQPPPEQVSCELTAIPSVVKPGEMVTLELNSKGPVTQASIAGNAVAIPIGRITTSKGETGDYTVVANVSGNSKTASCNATFAVRNGVPPPTSEFTLVPTHCGPNTKPRSGVASTCLSLVDRDPSWRDVSVSQLFMVTYTNGSMEALPILARQDVPGRPDALTGKTDLITYGGKVLRGATVPVMDTRRAQLTRQLDGDVPLSFDGYSSEGRLFLIERFNAYGMQPHLGLIPAAGQRRS